MAKDMGYVKNVVKEVKQTARRASNALAKKDREMYEKKYGRKINIKIGSSKVKEQVGQLAGAVLQGRRYDESGKMITSAKNKSGSKTPRRATRDPKAGPMGARQPMPKRVTTGVQPRVKPFYKEAASTTRTGASVAKKAAMPKPTPVKLPTVKARPGAKGTRDEMVKSTRILGGTGYAKEPFGKAVKRTSSVGQSVTPRKKKMK